MSVMEGLGWRLRLWRRRLSLATSFRNGVSLAAALRNRQPMARAVCWDGTVISHPADRLGLPETLLEVWCDQAYTRNFYHPSPGDRIIDGGANVGLFTLWVTRQARCRVVAFEPFAQNYEFLLQNLAAAHVTSVDTRRAGLSGSPGRARVAATARSLDHRLVPTETRDGPDTIPTYSLAQAVDLVGGMVEFCKLDIEGSERDVFESVDSGTLSRICRFAIEYHDNLRPGTLEIVRSRLAPTHDLRVVPAPGDYGVLYAVRRDAVTGPPSRSAD